MNLFRTVALGGIGTALCGIGVAGASAQIATAIISEGDALGGSTVDVIRFSGDANSVNGFVVQLDTVDGAAHIFGSVDGVTPNGIVRTAGTVGGFVQSGIDGEIGLSDAGVVTYGTDITEVTGAPIGNAIYQDDTLIVKEGDAAAGTATNFLDIVSTRSGTASFFGISPDNGLFVGAGLANSPQIGDTILGIAIDGFDEFQHGNSDANGPIQEVNIDTGSSADDGIVLINGAPIASGTGNIREGDAIPVADGGVGDDWDNFDFHRINENGTFLITGDTNQTGGTADEFVSINGKIIAREGDAIAGGIIDGGIENADLNEDDLWAAVWDFDTDLTGGGTDAEAIILGDAFGVSQLLIKEGDTVSVGGSLQTLTDITVGVAIGDVQDDGTYNVWFRGVSDGVQRQFVITVPEPSTLGLLGLGAALAVVRRRRA
ncbi:PEP-CTERM sorting domain-containing protein [Algisphaera agarilytica]|uniref:Putative Zn-binding protein involved in type VI secretion n=1 Tax=Algisphaera agarilytica TaxID=1385975 RepID=A0A7X0LM10_9BACT|nr:PEP-CTERM sorting domain-containing protein [Algisphaera agarilytica]MBB6431582.1 putative Zn-binding protein involved in type VI secretion [Algisphaera agarilytica]